MKIGIFGDSFSQLQNDKDYTWPVRLDSQCEVKNFSISGSGSKYSYLMYKENAHNFDKNIFICSNYNRYTLHKTWHKKIPAGADQLTHFNGNEPPIESKSKQYSDDSFEKKKFYNKMAKISNDFKVYFAEDPKVTKLMTDLILKDIYQDKNDTLILRAMNDTDSTEYCHNKVSLIDICDFSVHSSNHLNKAQHEIMYNKIHNWLIKGKFKLDENDQKIFKSLTNDQK